MGYAQLFPGRLVSPRWFLVVLFLGGCFVRPVCLEDGDCPDGQRCVLSDGTCVVDCTVDADCGSDALWCDGARCALRCTDAPAVCPDGMTSVCGALCMDTWEASRVDATASLPGSSAEATSQPGVFPWVSTSPDAMNREVATAACAAQGKRLCTGREWELVCSGPDATRYAYGAEYDPVTCNSIDAGCACDPEPHCYAECGGSFGLAPTGSFPDCAGPYGLMDLSGNAWEAVDAPDDLEHFRGGAYNCSDPELLHQCSYDATWDPSAKGFRCCADVP